MTQTKPATTPVPTTPPDAVIGIAAGVVGGGVFVVGAVIVISIVIVIVVKKRHTRKWTPTINETDANRKPMRYCRPTIVSRESHNDDITTNARTSGETTNEGLVNENYPPRSTPAAINELYYSLEAQGEAEEDFEGEYDSVKVVGTAVEVGLEDSEGYAKVMVLGTTAPQNEQSAEYENNEPGLETSLTQSYETKGDVTTWSTALPTMATVKDRKTPIAAPRRNVKAPPVRPKAATEASDTTTYLNTASTTTTRNTAATIGSRTVTMPAKVTKGPPVKAKPVKTKQPEDARQTRNSEEHLELVDSLYDMVTIEHGGELEMTVSGGCATPSGDELNYENVNYDQEEENPERTGHYYNQQEFKQDREETYYNQTHWDSENESVYYNQVVGQGW